MLCIGLFALFLTTSFYHPTRAYSEERITFLSLLESLTTIETAYEAPRFRSGSFSSFDREGGARDDQGYIRKEGDHYVIAEIRGPGAITRMWTSSPSGQASVYVDDAAEPLIQRDWWDLFQGKVIPFQEPFVKASVRQDGAHWSYVPIPFQEYFKIVLTDLCYYQIDYITFPIDAQVEALRIPFPRTNMPEVERIARRFSVPSEPTLPSGEGIENFTWRGTIPAGETIELATFSGPGVIRGIRMRWPEERDPIGRDLLFQAYWDHQETPALLSPLYDFFGGRMRSMYLGRSQQGWGYCFLPMPFQEVARFLLENGSLDQDYEVEFEAAFEAEVEPPDPLRRFYAYWRREIETPIGPVEYQPETGQPLSSSRRNFWATTVRGAGHLAGVSLHRSPCEASDSMLFFDQIEWPPTMPGTGRNGFFNLDGSGATETAPLSAGGGIHHNVEGMLRLMGPFSPDFRRNMQVGFEHGHANMLRKDMAAATYWYQQDPRSPFTWPLPAAARRFRTTEPTQSLFVRENDRLIPESLLEAETAEVIAVGGIFEPSDLRPYGPDWSGAQSMRFEGVGIDAFIEFDAPPLHYSGYYNFRAWMARSPDSAIVQVLVDSQEITASIDLYHPAVGPLLIETETPLFLHIADALQVKFVVVGQNQESSGYVINVDRMDFVAAPTSPVELDIAGPYTMEPTSSGNVATPIEGVSDETLRLGYGDSPVWETARALNNRISIPGPEDSFVLARWRVAANRSGIYRFEIEPQEASPFLIREQSTGLERLPQRILINGIPLQSDNVVRIDPETLEPAPTRFILPLREGENELMWLAPAGERSWMRPKIFGLE